MQVKEVQKHTQRIIEGGPERYAVSKEEDDAVWRQLAESGVPVYSTELVLTAVLHQKWAPEEHVLKNLREYYLSAEE